MASHDIIETPFDDDKDENGNLEMSLLQLLEVSMSNFGIIKQLEKNGVNNLLTCKSQELSNKLMREEFKEVCRMVLENNKKLNYIKSLGDEELLKQSVNDGDNEFFKLCGIRQTNYVIRNIYTFESYRHKCCCVCKDELYADISKLEAFNCKHVYHKDCLLRCVINSYQYEQRMPSCEPVRCEGCQLHCIYILPSQWNEAQDALNGKQDFDNGIMFSRIGPKDDKYNVLQGNMEQKMDEQDEPYKNDCIDVKHNDDEEINHQHIEQREWYPNLNEHRCSEHATTKTDMERRVPNIVNEDKETSRLIKATIKEEVHHALIYNQWDMVDQQGINELDYVEPYMVPYYKGKQWHEIISVLSAERAKRLGQDEHAHDIRCPERPHTDGQINKKYFGIMFELNDLFKVRMLNYERKDLYIRIPDHHDVKQHNNVSSMDNKRWRQMVKIYGAPYSWAWKNIYMHISKELESYFINVLSGPNNHRAAYNDALYQEWKRSAIPYEYCWIYRNNKKISERVWHRIVLSLGCDWWSHPVAHRNTLTRIYDNYGKRISIVDIIQSGRIYYRLYQRYDKQYNLSVQFIRYDARDPSEWYNKTKSDGIGDVPELIRWRMYGKVNYFEFLIKEREVYSVYCDNHPESEYYRFNGVKGLEWVRDYLRWQERKYSDMNDDNGYTNNVLHN